MNDQMIVMNMIVEENVKLWLRLNIQRWYGKNFLYTGVSKKCEPWVWVEALPDKPIPSNKGTEQKIITK